MLWNNIRIHWSLDFHVLHQRYSQLYSNYFLHREKKTFFYFHFNLKAKSKINKIVWLTHHGIHIIQIILIFLMIISTQNSKSIVISVADLISMPLTVLLNMFFWIVILIQARRDFHVDKGFQRLKNTILVSPQTRLTLPTSESVGDMRVENSWFSQYI